MAIPEALDQLQSTVVSLSFLHCVLVAKRPVSLCKLLNPDPVVAAVPILLIIDPDVAFAVLPNAANVTVRPVCVPELVFATDWTTAPAPLVPLVSTPPYSEK